MNRKEIYNQLLDDLILCLNKAYKEYEVSNEEALTIFFNDMTQIFSSMLAMQFCRIFEIGNKKNSYITNTPEYEHMLIDKVAKFREQVTNNVSEDIVRILTNVGLFPVKHSIYG